MEEQNQQDQNNNVVIDKSVKGAKALFWYLTLFFTLSITAFQTGNIWFQHINKWFPAEVIGGYVRQSFSQEALKFAIASILIAAPVYFFFGLMTRRALNKKRLDPHDKVRSWITYIILFLAIAIAVGDLITVIFRVLDGDFTARFLLKGFTILFIVSWIFAYYSLEIKSPTGLIGSKLPKTMGIITAIIIVVTFLSAFFIVDSPTTARDKAYDRTRVEDIRSLSYNIENYYATEGVLPESLEDINVVKTAITDPKTKETYGYEIINENSFNLCAIFEAESDEDDYYYRYDLTDFSHGAGEKCFELKIRKDLLPPDIKPIQVTEF